MVMASQVALVVKNPPANAGDVRDAGLIPGSGRSAGGGHGSHSGLQFTGSQRVGQMEPLSTCACMGVVLWCCMLAESVMEWKP